MSGKAMINNCNRRLALLLTYSGTLPLIICIILKTVSVQSVDVLFIAHAYSAIIISFLSGIHWSIYIFFSDRCPSNLLITSNVIALTAWSSLFISQQQASFLLQILCFVYLFILDVKLQKEGILPDWFYAIRRNATFVVILSLMVLASF